MKKAVFAAAALFLALSLCSCGTIMHLVNNNKKPAIPSVSHYVIDANETPAQDSPKPTEITLPSEDPIIPVETPEKPDSQNGSGLSVQTPSPSPSPKPSPAVERTPLSEDSLAFLTEYFAQQENNGFLLSSYDTPEDVDLIELFYAGAGIATWDVTQEEMDAYMAYYETDELWGGLMKLTIEQLDDFMLEKTGVSIWDTTSDWDWLYIEDFDAFYVERSDTNYGFLECVSGYKTSDGYVVVECQASGEYGSMVERCTVTLKKSGDNLLFVSNDAEMAY